LPSLRQALYLQYTKRSHAHMHESLKGAQAALLDRDVPNVLGIITDCAIGRELAARGNVGDALVHPLRALAVHARNTLLACNVRRIVRKDEIMVACARDCEYYDSIQ
jgi:hypothetical protein